MSFQRIALKTQMAHQPNHRDTRCRKLAKQLERHQPPPTDTAQNPVGGTVRVAGGGAMDNRKTSTAALDSFRHGLSTTSAALRATRPVQSVRSFAPGFVGRAS